MSSIRTKITLLNGIAIWLNEQSAREIYLLPFEYAVSEDKGFSHAVMSSFNRVGVKWSGAVARSYPIVQNK